MVMQESGEMYLETIYRLSQSLPVVRSIDVSEYIGYSKPSVSRAIGILKKQEYITVDKLGAITLTDKGRERAQYMPTDRAMTSEEAAQLVKWVIDMALGPDASNVQVEPMENYPASSKMPLIISMAGVQQHLFWFYPQQSFEEMCDALSAMLGEIPISCDSIPA